MKTCPFHILLVITASSFIAGCSDPAKEVPKSAAAEPEKTEAAKIEPASSTSGKQYVIRSDSTIGFTGSKVTGKHDGGFKNFAGTVNVMDGKITGTPEVKIGMNSTWADNDKLTGHLKSPDFFDVAKFPVTTFSITGLEAAGAQQKVTGNLNLHGVTKSISFPAVVGVGADAVTVKAQFAINRKDFGINYPGKANDLIRDLVVIRLDLKATPGPVRPEDQLAN
jgi:polyisoprenoid-binding protein YceI